ncbi:transposase, partial [Bacteroides acidifaciens]|uniref:transposase n=1 Tax=Bacteroides acidifaciens TaxID=85831 RepID=UPI001D16A27C
EQSGFDSFNTIAATLYDRSEEILNFYINRASNAAAESFNAKISNHSIFRLDTHRNPAYLCGITNY